MKEYKVFDFKKFSVVTPLLALFIPLPTCKYDPDFSYKGYGFGATIAISKIPLGIIMIILAIVF
jgi:hypothetical protein